MNVRLREEPREWQKFTIVSAVVISALAYYLHTFDVISMTAVQILGIALGLLILCCLVRPFWFRGIYRIGMIASAYVGMIVGGFLMTIMFLLILTPMGWLLRLMGKDLLRIKHDDKGTSYWCRAREKINLDRMF